MVSSAFRRLPHFGSPLILHSLVGHNDQGDIAGQWEDKAIDYNCHGMILHLPHRIVTFDIRGSYSTAATGINNSGQICGYFLDSVGSGKLGFAAQMTEP